MNCYHRFLKRLHQRSQFNIVHAHEIYPTGFIAAEIRQQLGCPVVITSHGGDVRAGHQHFKEPGLLQRYRLSVARADALIAISDFTRAGFRRLGAADDRIAGIPNGVDLSELAVPAARPRALDARIEPDRFFLFLGRLERQKGVDVLLQAMARMPRHQRIPLVIAGDGAEREALRQQAASLGLEREVRWTGMVRGKTKAYLAQNARCLIAPSRTWEAFGLIVLESFAAGRPVIASRLQGMADLIEPGVTGDLVRPESPQELAQAMQLAIVQPQRAQTMGQQARLVAQRYDWRKVATAHLQLYNNLRDRTLVKEAA